MMRRLIAAVAVASALMLAPTIAEASVSARRPPKACLRALDRAEEVMALAVQGFGAAGRAFQAASTFDSAGILAASEELNGLAPQVRVARSSFDVAAAQCRASR